MGEATIPDEQTLPEGPPSTIGGDVAPAAAGRGVPAIPGYEIEAEVGRGGMGVVYKARQARLNRTVALKMILAGDHASDEAGVRFLAEAEAAAKLQHPGVVQVFHIAEHGGHPYIEMEYVGGGSLADRLDGVPRPPREAAGLVEGLARAIAEAHRLGIVHRDLKPGNVLMTTEGAPKIADFGLAKLLGSDSGMTATESILGSPSYMAPEQAEGKTKGAGTRAVQYLRGHSATIEDVTFSRDGRRVASASKDGTVRLWDAEAGREVACFRGHTSDVVSVAFRPDGERLVSCGQDGTVKVWDVAASSAVLPLNSIGWGFRVAYGPDGTRLAAGFFGQWLLVDLATGRVLREIIPHSDIRLTTSPTGQVVREVIPRDKQSGGIFGLAFHPDGKRLATCSEFSGPVIIWDAETGTRVREFPERDGRSRAVAFSPDGRWLATAGDDGTVRFRDAETGRAGLVLGGHEGGAFAVAFDPEGRKVATLGWDGVVRLWDAATGGSLEVFRGTVQHKTFAFGNALAFDAGGRRLAATSDDGTVRVWDLDSPAAAALVLRGHSRKVNCVLFGPGERRITTASQDQTIKLWDASTGEEVFTLRGHTGGVLGIALSPDGRRIASTGTDTTARLWVAP